MVRGQCWAINLSNRGINWMLLLKGEHHRTSGHIWEVAPLFATAEARGFDSDWWVCCGLALNFLLTLSRSDRILNALGKQSESSMNPPPNRNAFLTRRVKILWVLWVHCAHSDRRVCEAFRFVGATCLACSFVWWPWTSGSRTQVKERQSVLCDLLLRQISLCWLDCHSFLRSVWAYKTKLSTKSIVPRKLRQISKEIASRILLSIAVFYSIVIITSISAPSK